MTVGKMWARAHRPAPRLRSTPLAADVCLGRQRKARGRPFGQPGEAMKDAADDRYTERAHFPFVRLADVVGVAVKDQLVLAMFVHRRRRARRD
jgi:hypothetical protein